MGLIPQAVIEEVLARTDILETVRQYVALKRAGSNYKGLCPFHDENTPSFNVHPGMGIYKCFGCGEGGNALQFLMAIEGWSFPETVRNLAERAGVEIPEESPEEAEKARKRREGRKVYLDIMASARAFFEKNLWGEPGAAARLYLKERDISEETARQFGLGYAIDGWDHLLHHLTGEGYKPEWLERAGLVMKKDRGGHYDRFRHRVVFPVVDVWGNTLAFGGRTLATESKGAKYINSPETPFYTKGEELYGLDVAKRSIQKEEYALVVEGNFDVIALHDAGVDVTVAPMGTALTEDQTRLMRRFARRVVIAFDGDSAGEEATLRCMGALEKAGLEAMVIRFVDGDDPDTFVRREGVEALQSKIDNARPLMAWALDRVIRPVEGAAIEVRVGALEDVAQLLDEIKDRVTWDHYAREAARRLDIDPGQMKNYLRRPEAARAEVKQQVHRSHQGAKLTSAEYGVLVVLLDHPEWLSDFFREELDKLLGSHDLARLLNLARDHYEANQEINRPLLIEEIKAVPLRETITRALAEPERGELYPPDQSLRWYRDCVWALKKRWAQRMAAILEKELVEVDFRTDRDRYVELTEQLKEVQQFEQALNLEGARPEQVKSHAG